MKELYREAKGEDERSFKYPRWLSHLGHQEDPSEGFRAQFMNDFASDPCSSQFGHFCDPKMQATSTSDII